MKLLIAEDDLTSRLLLSAIVQKWGFEIIAVEDGEAAWQIMQGNNAPKLLLLDWEMPKMNGLELCQHIRQQDDSNPPYIILLTARSEISDIVKGLTEGANDYIAKPFNHDELKVRLEVGQRVLQLQSELHAIKDHLSYERTIVESIIVQMRSVEKFDNTNLRYLETPVEKTSGDLLCAAYRPDKTQHIMLADFTGHGLTAAIGGPLASDTFYSMTAKGIPLAEIATEINHHMLTKMPTGLFLAAIFFEVNPQRNEVHIWNCGMESVLFFRDNKLLDKIPSKNLALGIIKQSIDEVTSLKINSNDRLYAYSDGITETTNQHNEMFGQQRLIESITLMLNNNDGIHSLTKSALEFRGEGEQLDDLTLVELSC